MRRRIDNAMYPNNLALLQYLFTENDFNEDYGGYYYGRPYSRICWSIKSAMNDYLQHENSSEGLQRLLESAQQSPRQFYRYCIRRFLQTDTNATIQARLITAMQSAAAHLTCTYVERQTIMELVTSHDIHIQFPQQFAPTHLRW